MVMSLLINCLCTPHCLCVCLVLCVCLCFGMHYCVSFPCSNHLEEKDFVFIVSSMSCHFICSVALPHGDMGWSAVCDSGISWS